jgi:uncharacterized protein YjdB
MKKIIAFIIMVIVIILIIVLSYNYYNKKSNNKKLKPDTSSELILHNRDKDKDKDENSSNSGSETTNSNTPSTEAEDTGNVPNTASIGDGEFIPVDHVDVKIAESVIKVDQRTKIVVTFYPGNASDRNVFFSSNDKNVARVTSTGEVIGVGKGSTIIDVTVQDDTYKVLVTVI